MRLNLFPLFIAITGFAFVLRVVSAANLKSIWLDEATWISIARNPLTKLLNNDSLDFASFRLIPHLFNKLIIFFSSDEHVLRYSQILISILVLWIFYHVAREILKKEKPALIAFFLMSISAYNIRYSSEIKYHGISNFFNLASLLFFLKVTKPESENKKQPVYFLLFAIFSTLALFSDYNFIWLYSVYAISFLIQLFYGNFHNLRTKKYAALSMLPPVFIVIWHIPYLDNLLTHHSLADSFIGKISFPDLFAAIKLFLTNFDSKYSVYAENGYFPMNFFKFLNNYLPLVTFLPFMPSFNPKTDKQISFLKLLVFFPLLSSFAVSQFITPVFVHYNLMIVQMGIVITVAAVYGRFRKTGAIILVIYLILNTAGYASLLREGTIHDYRKINNFLLNTVNSKETSVLILPDYHHNGLKFYAEKEPRFPGQFIPLAYEDSTGPMYVNEIKKEVAGTGTVCYILDPAYTENRINVEITVLLKEKFIPSKKMGPGTGFEVSCYLRQQTYQ